MNDDSDISDEDDVEVEAGNVLTNISLALSILHGASVTDPKCRAHAVVRLLQVCVCVCDTGVIYIGKILQCLPFLFINLS